MSEAIESAKEWCHHILDNVDKRRADEIIDAVEAKPTDRATIIAVCTRLLGELLADVDDPVFPAALALMIGTAARRHRRDV